MLDLEFGGLQQLLAECAEEMSHAIRFVLRSKKKGK